MAYGLWEVKSHAQNYNENITTKNYNITLNNITLNNNITHINADAICFRFCRSLLLCSADK